MADASCLESFLRANLRLYSNFAKFVALTAQQQRQQFTNQFTRVAAFVHCVKSERLYFHCSGAGFGRVVVVAMPSSSSSSSHLFNISPIFAFALRHSQWARHGLACSPLLLLCELSIYTRCIDGLGHDHDHGDDKPQKLCRRTKYVRTYFTFASWIYSCSTIYGLNFCFFFAFPLILFRSQSHALTSDRRPLVNWPNHSFYFRMNNMNQLHRISAAQRLNGFSEATATMRDWFF